MDPARNTLHGDIYQHESIGWMSDGASRPMLTIMNISDMPLKWLLLAGVAGLLGGGSGGKRLKPYRSTNLVVSSA